MSLVETYSAVFIDDGLPLEKAKKRFSDRRDALREKINAPCLIFGVQEALTRNEPWLLSYAPYYQEPLMSFYTGINQAKTALLIHPNGNDILFVPEKDPKKEFWDGIQFGCGTRKAESDVMTIVGISLCKPIDTLFETMVDLVKNEELNTLYSFWYERFKQDTTYKMKQKLQRALKGTDCSLLNVGPYIWEQRLCLDDVDQANLRVANHKASDVFTAVCKHATTATNEREIHGVLTGEVLKASWLGHSFPPIVAHGKNATILHYNANNAPLHRDQLLLLDYGVREHHMPSDVSRTIPLSGSFSPLQALLYSIVLETQRTVEKEVKEGISISTLNTLCWETMNQLLEERFLSQGGKMTRDYTVAPHNVSHLIGIMVHDGDPKRHYAKNPLKAGMVISNEPGLYGDFEWVVGGETVNETIGIRIEDNLLVTKTGSRNLTSTPKSIQDIETLMAV